MPSSCRRAARGRPAADGTLAQVVMAVMYVFAGSSPSRGRASGRSCTNIGTVGASARSGVEKVRCTRAEEVACRRTTPAGSHGPGRGTAFNLCPQLVGRAGTAVFLRSRGTCGRCCPPYGMFYVCMARNHCSPTHAKSLRELKSPVASPDTNQHLIDDVGVAGRTRGLQNCWRRCG